MGSIAGKDSAGAVDLERQPRVRVGCHLCGSTRSRLVCSAEDIAARDARRDVERQLADREEWERESWLDTRTHVLAWHGWMPAFDGSKRTVASSFETTTAYDGRSTVARR